MKYLLDTCVISELIKSKPNQNVVSWIKKNNEQDYYLSSLTIGEIHKGIAKLSDKNRKEKLHLWVEYDLKERFQNRIIPVDVNIARTWGQIQGRAEAIGKPMPAIDSLIAATGLCLELIVVTQNISDMRQSKVILLNPWE